MLTATSEPYANTEKRNAGSQASRYATGELLARDVRVRLSRLRPWALASTLIFDFTVIIATAAICEYFFSPTLYLLGAMIIAARQAGIGSIGMHDGVHRLLSRNRRRNDFLGRSMSAMVCASIVMGFDAYREHHFDHHRDTNTEDDPDHEFVEKLYKMPRWAAALMMLSSLTGMLFLFALVRYVYRNSTKQPFSALVTLATAVSLAAGCWAGVYPIVLIVKYWYLPLATWGVFANQLRALAEHYPENEFERGADVPEVFRTREILNSWFDQVFLVTRGVNFHLSHHLCPQIPFYHLPQLQAELAKSDVYQRYAHVTRGYHRFLIEFFFQRNKCAAPCLSGQSNEVLLKATDAG